MKNDSRKCVDSGQELQIRLASVIQFPALSISEIDSSKSAGLDSIICLDDRMSVVKRHYIRRRTSCTSSICLKSSKVPMAQRSGGYHGKEA